MISGLHLYSTFNLTRTKPFAVSAILTCKMLAWSLGVNWGSVSSVCGQQESGIKPPTLQLRVNVCNFNRPAGFKLSLYSKFEKGPTAVTSSSSSSSCLCIDLMTEMMDLSSDVGGPGLPLLDYRTYAERVFFPGQQVAPLSRQLDLPESRRQTVEQGLQQLNNLLNNRLFLTRVGQEEQEEGHVVLM